MDLPALRRLVVLAEAGGVTRAAARLYLSQPALTRYLQRLERDVGAPLFERHGRRLALTPAGEIFAASARRLLADFDGAVAAARAVADHRDGPTVLRIGLFFPSAAELTRLICSAYGRVAPHVRKAFTDVTVAGGEQALLRRDVDVAFLWTPLGSVGLASVSLFRDQPVALLAPSNPLASRATVSVAELAGQPFTVTQDMGSRWQAASTLHVWVESGRPVHVPTVNDALLAISQGRAVSVGPRSLERFRPSIALTCVPLTDHLAECAIVAWRADDERSHVRQFVALSASLAAQLLDVVPGAREPAA